MKRATFLFSVVAALGCGGSLSPARAAGAWEYRGFAVDDAAVREGAQVAEIREVMREQLDMVFAVGLSPAVTATLQKVPISVLPAGSFNAPTPGRYLDRARRVQLLESFVKFRHKPVLLHELMHAYHHQILPAGMQNAEVLGFYERAKGLNAYEASSHMMANVGEYFACSATAYLYGQTAQEPFTRAKVREKQPGYFEYLQKLFGPGVGRYAGSLADSPPKKSRKPKAE